MSLSLYVYDTVLVNILSPRQSVFLSLDNTSWQGYSAAEDFNHSDTWKHIEEFAMMVICQLKFVS